MTRALTVMLLAGAALAPSLAQAADAAAVDPAELPPGRCRGAVHRADQADRSAAERHFRPRLPTDLPRRGGAGRERDGACGGRSTWRASRARCRSGTLACRAEESATIDNVGAVRALTCRDEAAGLDYRRYAVQRGKTTIWPKGWPAMTRRCGWRWRRWSPTGRSRARFRSRRPRSATRPPSPGSRPARSTPPGRGSRPIPATMPAASPKARNSSKAWPSRDVNEPSSLAEALANQGLQQSNLGNFARGRAAAGPGRGRQPARRRRDAAADPQLSRDQPAQPAPSRRGDGRAGRGGRAGRRGRGSGADPPTG